MPFTPTHILAVVPLAAVGRGRLPFSALAIGSMVPDLPLFVPIVAGYQVTHAPEGVISADLPLGVIGFLVFQMMLKRPLFALLPAGIQRRCAGPARASIDPSVGFLLRAALAVVLGATTHLVWDSFTHRDRAGTHLVPGLNAPLLVVGGHPVAGYKALQYGCTGVGLPALALMLVAWLRRQPAGAIDPGETLTPAAKRVASLVALAIPAAGVAYVLTRADFSPYQKLDWAITRSGTGLLLALFAYAVAFHIRRRVRVVAPPGGRNRGVMVGEGGGHGSR